MSNISNYQNLPAFLRKKRGRRYRGDDMIETYRPLLAIWLLEMALFFDWYQKPNARTLPDIFEEGSRFMRLTEIELGLDEDDPEEAERVLRRLSNTALADILRKKLAHWKKQPFAGEQTLLTNLGYLGEVLSLNSADLALLSFALFIRLTPIFERVISGQNQQVTVRQLACLVAMLTGHSESEMLKSLHPESRLLASGLLKVERGNADLENKLDVMDTLAGAVMTPHSSSGQLASRFLQPAGPTKLALDDFPHLEPDIATLKSYLREAALRGEPGVNILFYGPPGTGKTEMAKALAGALGHAVYEIGYSDEDGDPISGEKRLRAYNFCQRLLEGNRNAILMFDEIEDVICAEAGGLMVELIQPATPDDHKAWLNRTLERNPVPAIWVTNDSQIDPAYRRRFDYSVHFPVPPLDVRKAIVHRHLGELAPDQEWIDAVAANEHVSPAQYERMAKVARIAGKSGDERPHLLAERALDRSMRLLGQKHLPARNKLQTVFRREFINADHNLDRLVAGLKIRPHGALCLYGPPGTGKSELARHIADEIGQPLIVQRASDLLDKYVGGSEANIAKMFTQAREREGILVLDEADSFLADRRGAQRQWEVSQVNELLTQMEAFEGIFICTTNLMANLDQASLRRFAFKIRFDFLTPEQRYRMAQAEFKRLGGNSEELAEKEAWLHRLDRLTPGDFATVARKYRTLGEAPAAKEYLEMLELECRAKGGATHIGFC